MNDGIGRRVTVTLPTANEKLKKKLKQTLTFHFLLSPSPSQAYGISPTNPCPLTSLLDHRRPHHLPVVTLVTASCLDAIDVLPLTPIQRLPPSYTVSPVDDARAGDAGGICATNRPDKD